MPGAKNGERPYLAVPEPLFWGLFFAHFYGILLSSSSHSHTHNPSASNPASTQTLFIFYFNQEQQR